MVDPDRYLILAPPLGGGEIVDKTKKVRRCSLADGKVRIEYADCGTAYSYSHPNARLLEYSHEIRIEPEEQLRVRGRGWGGGLTAALFTDVWDREYSWVRIVSHDRAYTYPAEAVEIVSSAAADGRAAEVRRYWKDVVKLLGPENWTRKGHERLDFIDPDSALAAYLDGANGGTQYPDRPVILPFNGNEDQRDAVVKALRNRISVIDGPPGTGKTETILNIVANLLQHPKLTAGIVSFSNAAVDNVRDKLDEAGLGFVAARLGNKRMVAEFLRGQESRTRALANWKAGRTARSGDGAARADWEASDGARQAGGLQIDGSKADGRDDGLRRAGPSAAEPNVGGRNVDSEIAEAESRLVGIWRASRELAEVRRSIEECALEFSHFERRMRGERFADLDGLPLLRKSSDTIVKYLAESAVRAEPPGGLSGIVGRIRRHFEYGSLKSLDPRDADVVLRLQRAFYTRSLEEFEERKRLLEETLARADEESVRKRHKTLSRHALDDALRRRYRGAARKSFDDEGLHRQTKDLLREYPVVLTTCHSIRSNLAEGTLLDWLIIDEATLTDVLSAALALSRARNVVVVGDLKQLAPVLDKKWAKALPAPPDPAYDVGELSILESVKELYGESLPQTMLREHFRCAPEIIGFCNGMFYGGQLIPLADRPGEAAGPSLAMFKTAPGNHCRRIARGPVKGRYNQREIDVVMRETLAECGISPADLNVRRGSDLEVGFAAPFRLHADRLDQALEDAFGGRVEGEADGGWLSETVHKFQGRGARTMVFSTVLDESRDGRRALSFADDPRLINVAVSRAKERFVLVTDDGEMRGSVNISALADYIRYQCPDQVVESRIVSVFDLLYRKHSERLAKFASGLRGKSKYKSENIMYTLLKDLLGESKYEGWLDVAFQVRLRDLVPDLALLSERQRKFVRSTSAVDFVVYHAVTCRALLAIEVDGTAFHEDKPLQLRRDGLKQSILSLYGVKVLSFRTNGSDEEGRMRQELDRVLAEGLSDSSGVPAGPSA